MDTLRGNIKIKNAMRTMKKFIKGVFTYPLVLYYYAVPLVASAFLKEKQEFHRALSMDFRGLMLMNDKQRARYSYLLAWARAKVGKHDFCESLSVEDLDASIQELLKRE